MLVLWLIACLYVQILFAASSLPSFGEHSGQFMYENENAYSVLSTLRQRMDTLGEFAATNKDQMLFCNTTNRYVVLTDAPYGQAGNNLIEFIHGLWLAKLINATFAVPKWMQEGLLKEFHLHGLMKYHCLSFEVDLNKHIYKPENEVHQVDTEHAFWIQKYWEPGCFGPAAGGGCILTKYLPPMSEELLDDATLHYLQVVAVLWSHPRIHMLHAATWLIHHKLGNNFRYTSAHKRNLDGGCKNILTTNTQKADYSSHEIPLADSLWSRGEIAGFHPLCAMSSEYISETQNMHGRNGSLVFLAWDGQVSIEDQLDFGVIVSSKELDKMQTGAANIADENLLDKNDPEYGNNRVDDEDGVQTVKIQEDVDTHNFRYLDMFVSMHGDLFLQNPRSTFSFEIFLVRAILNLETVPLMRYPFDLYLQKYPDEYGNRVPWVSWSSVLNTIHKHRRRHINQ